MFDRGPGSAGLDPESFRTLSRYLERLVADVRGRFATRRSVLDRAGGLNGEVTQAWRSPKATSMAEETAAFLRSAREPDGTFSAACEAIATLEREARRMADVLDEVEDYEKAWNQQLVANWSEWQDRITTSLASHLPGGDDDQSRRLTEDYQEQTRRTEEASRRRHDALVNWHRVCSDIARTLTAATDALHQLSSSPPPASLNPDRPRSGGNGGGPLEEALRELRVVLGAPGPVDLARIDAQLDRLSSVEIEMLIAQLTDEQRDRWLAALPEAQRRRLNSILGRMMASDTRNALRDSGIDPDRFNPAVLKRLDPRDPRYGHLIDTLDRCRRRLADADYAAAYVAGLDTEGTRALVGTLEQLQLHRQQRWDVELPGPADRIERITIDVIAGFALASRSPATEQLRRDLLAPRTAWQHHQLSLLLSGPGSTYDPAFVAAAADTLLIEHPEAAIVDLNEVTRADEYPPFAAFTPLWSESWRNTPDAIALKALAENTEAAARFVHDANGPRTRQIDYFVRHRDYEAFASSLSAQLNIDHDRAAELGRSMNASTDTALRNVLQRAEANRLLTHDQASDLYAHIVRDVARNDGEPTAGAKVVLADSLALYLPDIATEARKQYEHQLPFTEEELDNRAFLRPDMVSFIATLATDADAAKELGESALTWSSSELAGWTDPAVPLHVNQDRLASVTDMIGLFEDGLAEASREHEDTYSGYASGIDIAGQLLADDILSSVPVFGPAASAAAKPLTALATGALGDRMTDGAGDRAPLKPGTFGHQLQNELKRQLAIRLAVRDAETPQAALEVGGRLSTPAGDGEIDSTIRAKLPGGDAFAEKLNQDPSNDADRYAPDDQWNEPSNTGDEG